MAEIVAVNGVLKLLADLRQERLAVSGLLGVVAGDDLDAAIARMERVVGALPDVREAFPGRAHKVRRQRELAKRVEELAKSGLRDLRQLRAVAESREESDAS